MMADWSKSGGLGGYESEPIRRLESSDVVFTHYRSEKQTKRLFLVTQRTSGERLFGTGIATGITGDDCVLRTSVSSYGVAVQVLGIPGEYDIGVALAPAYQSLQLAKLSVSALDPKNTGVVMEAFGSSGVAYFRNAGTSSRYDFRTKQAKTMSVDGFAWTPWGEGALAFGSDSGAALPARIGYVAPDGTLTKLVDAGPGRLIGAMAVDRGVTPNQLVWLEGTEVDGGIAKAEVWTSPLATAPGGIQRKLVAKTSVAVGMLKSAAADRGRFLMLADRDAAQMIRLSDGRGWRVNAEPGDGIPDVLGFDDENVWVSIVEDNPTLSDLGSANGILRLRLDSLGEPTFPNGL